MDKIKLEFNIPEKKTIEYKGIKFEITPFLTMAQRITLANLYLRDYFGKNDNPLIEGSKYSLIEAEFNLTNRMIQTLTNIDVESLSDEAYVSTDFLVFFHENIENYWDFKNELGDLVDEIQNQIALDNTLGSVVSGLVDRAYELLNKLANITPEEIENAKKAGVELIERLEKNSILVKPEVESEEKKA